MCELIKWVLSAISIWLKNDRQVSTKVLVSITLTSCLTFSFHISNSTLVIHIEGVIIWQALLMRPNLHVNSSSLLDILNLEIANTVENKNTVESGDTRRTNENLTENTRLQVIITLNLIIPGLINLNPLSLKILEKSMILTINRKYKIRMVLLLFTMRNPRTLKNIIKMNH